MECVALKSNSRKTLSVNLSPQVRWDVFGSSTVQTVICYDEFSVDELLNFSQEDVFEGKENGEKEEDKEHKSFARVSVSQQEPEDCENQNESFSVTDRFGCLSMSDLSVQIDDFVDLEWLSDFIDESFYEHYAAFLAGMSIEKPTDNDLEKETEASTPLGPQRCFKTLIPAKARSKRPRIGGRVWVVGGVVPPSKDINCRYAKPPATKSKIKSAVNKNGGSQTTQTTRRCSHCGVQKTTLCRVGPDGAKTLCNACAIQYKSGRLLPEYRQACSPTFSTELHSNNHLTVLQMRWRDFHRKFSPLL